MSQTQDTIIRGALLAADLEAGPVDVQSHGERIVAVGAAGSLTGGAVVDADGLWLLPGVIDAHVHPIHNETFASVGRAAVYGGVTTILHHLYPDAGESPSDALARGEREIAAGLADGGFHVRVRGDSLSRVPGPSDVGRYTAVKLFLAHTDPTVEVDLGGVFEIMRWAAGNDALVYIHAEHGQALQRGELLDGPAQTLEAWSANRSDQLEASAVASVAALAMLTGARLHIPHISSAAALDAALAARRAGARLTLETCPQYLFLTSDSGLGGYGRCAPPLRTEADAEALRAAAGQGLLDVVASDHCGYAPEQKSASVAASSNGLPGLETLLALLLDAAVAGDWMTPPRLVELLASGPARVFSLRGKGRIAPGYDADLVIVDPSASRRILHSELHDRAGYTPYEGRDVRGAITQVIRRGETLVRDGALLTESAGRMVPVAQA